MNEIVQFADPPRIESNSTKGLLLSVEDYALSYSDGVIHILHSANRPDIKLRIKDISGHTVAFLCSDSGTQALPLFESTETVTGDILSDFERFFDSIPEFSCVDTLCAGYHKEHEQLYLVSLNLQTKDIAITEENERRSVCARDDGLYMSWWSGTIEKRDTATLKQVWQTPRTKTVLTKSLTEAYLWDNTLVMYVGADRATRKEGEVLGLNRDTGEVRWRKVFERAVDNCLGVDDRIYVAHGPEMVVLDAASGRELLRRQSGLSANKATTLWSDGSYLYFFSVDEARFLVFDGDGQELVHDVTMPEEFRLDYMDRDYTLPVRIPGGALIHLRSGAMDLNTALYGLLKFTPGEGGLHPPITIEQGPPVEIETIKEADGTESYVITLDSDRDDDLVRFGELHTKGLASTRGTQIWSAKRRRKKFNGRIRVRIVRKVEDEARFSSLMDGAIARIHHWASVMGVVSGTKKDPIAISWEWKEPCP